MTTQHPTARTITADALLSPRQEIPLSAEDRLAIHELIARNYLVEDTRDEAHLASIVTEDFKQEHVIFGATEGRDGLAALLRDNPELFDGIRHEAVNITAVGTGPNTAEAVHYIIVMQVHAVDAEPPAPLPRPIGHGVVRDQLVKQNGRWLIHRRVYDQMSIAVDLLPDDQRQTAARRLTPDWERE